MSEMMIVRGRVFRPDNDPGLRTLKTLPDHPDVTADDIKEMEIGIARVVDGSTAPVFRAWLQDDGRFAIKVPRKLVLSKESFRLQIRQNDVVQDLDTPRVIDINPGSVDVVSVVMSQSGVAADDPLQKRTVSGRLLRPDITSFDGTAAPSGFEYKLAVVVPQFLDDPVDVTELSIGADGSYSGEIDLNPSGVSTERIGLELREINTSTSAVRRRMFVAKECEVEEVADSFHVLPEAGFPEDTGASLDAFPFPGENEWNILSSSMDAIWDGQLSSWDPEDASPDPDLPDARGLEELACINGYPVWVVWLYGHAKARAKWIHGLLGQVTTALSDTPSSSPTLAELEEALFGMQRVGASLSWSHLLSRSRSDLEEALHNAAFRYAVSNDFAMGGAAAGRVLDGLEWLGARWKGSALRRAAETFHTASTLTRYPTITDTDLAAAAAEWATDVPADASTWGSAPSGVTDEAWDELRASWELRQLAGWDPDVLSSIGTDWSTSTPGDGRLQTLIAGKDFEDWVTATSTTPPPWSPASTQKGHVRWLASRVEASYPTETLRTRLPGSSFTNVTLDSEVGNALQNAVNADASFADLDLSTDAGRDVVSPSGSPLTDPDATIADLHGLQQVYRMAPALLRSETTGTVMNVLEQGGVSPSAVRIAARGRSAFVGFTASAIETLHGNGIGGSDIWDSTEITTSERTAVAQQVAAFVHDQATRLAGAAAMRRLDRVTQGASSVTVQGGGAALALPSTSSSPIMEELGLGGDTVATCDHAMSVFGPGAYLFDLLHFCASEDGDLGLRALEYLDPHATSAEVDRRAEVLDVEFDAANANTLLPEIDLVIELLEHRVVMQSTDPEALPTRTSWSEQALLAGPEHTQNRATAEAALASGPGAISVAGQLSLEELRALLAAEDVDRASLVDLVRPYSDQTDPPYPGAEDDLDQAIETLRLAPATYGLVTASITKSTPHDNAAYDTLAGLLRVTLAGTPAWPDTLVERIDTTRAYGISSERLDAILALPWVNENGTIGVNPQTGNMSPQLSGIGALNARWTVGQDGQSMKLELGPAMYMGSSGLESVADATDPNAPLVVGIADFGRALEAEDRVDVYYGGAGTWTLRKIPSAASGDPADGVVAGVVLSSVHVDSVPGGSDPVVLANIDLPAWWFHAVAVIEALAPAFDDDVEAADRALRAVATSAQLDGTASLDDEALERLAWLLRIADLTGAPVAEVAALFSGWDGLGVVTRSGIADAPWDARFQNPAKQHPLPSELELSATRDALASTGGKDLGDVGESVVTAVGGKAAWWTSYRAFIDGGSDPNAWLPSDLTLSKASVDHLSQVALLTRWVGGDVDAVMTLIESELPNPFGGATPDPKAVLQTLQRVRGLVGTVSDAAVWRRVLVDQSDALGLEDEVAEISSTYRTRLSEVIASLPGLLDEPDRLGGRFDWAAVIDGHTPGNELSQADFEGFLAPFEANVAARGWTLGDAYAELAFVGSSNVEEQSKRQAAMNLILDSIEEAAPALFGQIFPDAMARMSWIVSVYPAILGSEDATSRADAIEALVDDIVSAYWYRADHLALARHLERTELIDDAVASLLQRWLDDAGFAFDDMGLAPHPSGEPVLTDPGGAALIFAATRPAVPPTTGLQGTSFGFLSVALIDEAEAASAPVEASLAAMVTQSGTALDGADVPPPILLDAVFPEPASGPAAISTFADWADLINSSPVEVRVYGLASLVVPHLLGDGGVEVLSTALSRSPGWIREVAEGMAGVGPASSSSGDAGTAWASLVHPDLVFGASSGGADWLRGLLVRLLTWRDLCAAAGADERLTRDLSNRTSDVAVPAAAQWLHPDDLGTPAWADGATDMPSLQQAWRFTTIVRLHQEYGPGPLGQATRLYAFVRELVPGLDGAPDDGPTVGPSAFVQRRLGWSSEVYSQVMGVEGLSQSGPPSSEYVDFALDLFERLTTMDAMARRFGVAPTALFPAGTRSFEPGTSNSAVSDALVAWKGAMRGAVSEEVWASKSRAAADTMRRRRRDALMAWLLANVDDWNSVADVQAALLCDPMVEPPVRTSRLLFATAAVQTYIQRATLGLEDVELSEEGRERWAWMKNYRVWEAARKLLVYPENWVEPDLRTDATELYASVEREIRSGSLDADRVEEIVGTYVHGLASLSELRVVSIAMEKRPGDEGTLHGHSLHLLASDGRDPATSWYRARDGHGRWQGWEAITMDVDTTTGVLGSHRGIPFCMWLSLTELPSETGRLAYRVTANWIVRRSDGWQVAPGKADVAVLEINAQDVAPIELSDLMISTSYDGDDLVVNVCRHVGRAQPIRARAVRRTGWNTSANRGEVDENAAWTHVSEDVSSYGAQLGMLRFSSMLAAPSNPRRPVNNGDWVLKPRLTSVHGNRFRTPSSNDGGSLVSIETPDDYSLLDTVPLDASVFVQAQLELPASAERWEPVLDTQSSKRVLEVAVPAFQRAGRAPSVMLMGEVSRMFLMERVTHSFALSNGSNLPASFDLQGEDEPTPPRAPLPDFPTAQELYDAVGDDLFPPGQGQVAPMPVVPD